LKRYNADAEETKHLTRAVFPKVKEMPREKDEERHSAADNESEENAFGTQSCERIPVADLVLIHITEYIDRDGSTE
jgi:hypothetical protein